MVNLLAGTLGVAAVSWGLVLLLALGLYQLGEHGVTIKNTRKELVTGIAGVVLVLVASLSTLASFVEFIGFVVMLVMQGI